MPLPSTHLSLLRELCDTRPSEEAWAVFHARYRGVILHWCRRRVEPDVADDLTQDVLLKLFEKLPHYRHDPNRGAFRSWLAAVVNNTLCDFWRRQQRRLEVAAPGGTSFLEKLLGAAAPAAEELSIALDDVARVTADEVFGRVRAKVKETTWQAFYQKMVEQRPAADIAAELGLSVASVYKSTFRVKQMLLEEYRRATPPSGDDLPDTKHAGEIPA